MIHSDAKSEQVMQTEKRPKCPKCSSQNGYIRIKTDELVCRECGTVSPLPCRIK